MSTSLERLRPTGGAEGLKFAPIFSRASRPFLSRAARWGTSFATASALLVATSTPSFADDEPRGAGPMNRANTAWGRGEFDVAEALYHEALEQGGLSRDSTLKAYVYMACARAVQGKREQALSAFRQAVLIDAHFAIPSEAGKKAVALGEQVRAKEGHVGPFVLQTEAPQRVASGTAFTVKVTMDESRAALLTRVALKVTGGLGPGSFETEQEVPQGGDGPVKMKFDVPAKIAMPGSELKIRLAGLDPHDNELVTADAHTSVAGSGVAVVGGHGHETTEPPPEKKKGGGFWSSPAPYIIAGLALAGAGVGVYFATRPGDEVSLASVKVQSQ